MVRMLWSRWAWPILGGRTRRVALPVALVVGTLLLVVSQGSALATGQVDAATVLRGLANYGIPYVVASVGYLNALPDQHSPSQDLSSS